MPFNLEETDALYERIKDAETFDLSGPLRDFERHLGGSWPEIRRELVRGRALVDKIELLKAND